MVKIDTRERFRRLMNFFFIINLYIVNRNSLLDTISLDGVVLEAYRWRAHRMQI